MADTLKDFTVTCPDCNEEFEAGIPEAALLPEAEPYSIECPECGEEWQIVYDPATQTLTLEGSDWPDDGDEGDPDMLGEGEDDAD